MLSDIATLGQCISYLQVGDTMKESQLAMLQLIKRLVEQAVRLKMQCSVTQDTYTHYLPMVRHYADSQMLRMSEWPIRSITSINEDNDAYFGEGTDAFPSGSLLTAGTDYCLPKSQDSFGDRYILKIGDNWSKYAGSIKVVYVAGWTADELHGDVTDARFDASVVQNGTLDAVRDLYSYHSALAPAEGEAVAVVESERLGDYSVKYRYSMDGRESRSIIDGALCVLDKFKQVTWAV